MATGSTVLSTGTWYRIEIRTSTGGGSQPRVPMRIRVNLRRKDTPWTLTTFLIQLRRTLVTAHRFVVPFAAQRSVTRGRAKKTYTNESGTKLSGTLHSAISSASACKTGAAACSLLRAFRS